MRGRTGLKKKGGRRKKGRVEETSLRGERRGEEDCHRRSIVSLRRDANVIHRPGYIDIQIYDPNPAVALRRDEIYIRINVCLCGGWGFTFARHVSSNFLSSFLSFVRSFVRLIRCQPYFEAELDARINSSNFPPFIARILISHRVHTRLREFLLLLLVRNLNGSWRLFSRETLKLYVQLFPLSWFLEKEKESVCRDFRFCIEMRISWMIVE